MEVQSALGTESSVICQAAEMGRYVPVAQATWSRQCDGVYNRHMKDDPVRSCSMLWISLSCMEQSSFTPQQDIFQVYRQAKFVKEDVDRVSRGHWWIFSKITSDGEWFLPYFLL